MLYRTGAGPVDGAEGGGQKKRTEWIRHLVMPIAAAVAVAAITPLGDGLRELLFPTGAAVSGTVLQDGEPVAGAQLELDGKVVSEKTDERGAFLLTDVGDGQHELRAHAPGARAGTTRFVVPRNATEVEAKPAMLRPLVTMGFAIVYKVREPKKVSSRAVLDYDLAMWINGPVDVLHRIRDVAYVLPAPLPATPVTGTPPAPAFCYRQTGLLSFPRLVTPKLDIATATIRLDDGKSFPVAGRAGKLRPPDCKSVEAPRVTVPRPRSPGAQPRATWPSRATPTPGPSVATGPVTEPQVPTIERFSAGKGPICTATSGTASVQLTIRAKNAVRYEITGAGAVRTGADPASTKVSVRIACDGSAHTYHLTVFADDGRTAKATCTVRTGPLFPTAAPPPDDVRVGE